MAPILDSIQPGTDLKQNSRKNQKRPIHWIKRCMDIFFCLLYLPVALPLGLLLALCIRLDSKGAPIYKQERIGRNGRHFIIYKFRTMTENADELLATYLENDEDLAREWEETQKLKNDPRLTRMGRFLRKTSLDELPQVINILLGNMSIVGPRPIVESEKERYGKRFREYCEVYPGLTGLWQTSGRNNTTYPERVAYDHYYINHWSLWLDLWIMAKTVPQIIRGYGAY